MYLTISITLIIFYLLCHIGFDYIFKPVETTEKTFWELDEQFSRIESVLFLYFLASTIGIGFGFWHLLNLLVEIQVSNQFEYIYLIPPDSRLIMLITISMSLSLSALLVYSITKHFISDWAGFLQYSEQKYNTGYWRLGKLMFKIILMITIGAYILALDWYTVFTNEQIIVNEYFSTENKTYEYKDIVKISEHDKRIAPSGNIADRHCFVLKFTDQSLWDSSESGFSTTSENEELIEFLLKKTQLPLVYEEYK